MFSHFAAGQKVQRRDHRRPSEREKVKLMECDGIPVIIPYPKDKTNGGTEHGR